MKVAVMRWYRILIDGQEHIVRIDGVVDYYDARLWCAGSLSLCKKFITQHIPEGIYDKEGAYRGN